MEQMKPTILISIFLVWPLNTAISQVVISDKGLEKAIRATLQIDSQTTITDSIALSLFALDASVYGIAELNGIEHFKNLKIVILKGNFITDIQPLYTLPYLTYLNISENQVSDISPMLSFFSTDMTAVVDGNCIGDFSVIGQNTISNFDLIGADNQRSDCSAPQLVDILYHLDAEILNPSTNEVRFWFRGWSNHNPSGVINFGDGTSANAVCDAQTKHATHIYSSLNDITAQLILNNETLSLNLLLLGDGLNLIYPPNGDTIDNTTPYFEWSASQLPDVQYQIHVTNDTNAYVFTGYALDTNFVQILQDTLPACELFHWKVRPFEGNTMGKWSDTFSFFIKCSSPSSKQLSGRLIWEGDIMVGVDSAFVRISGDLEATVPTAPGGYFSWLPITGNSFDITPFKPSPPAEWDNGVNAADALAIMRHVAGIEPITDPYRLIAADVDLDNIVTNGDAVVIRRALLKSPSAIAVMQDSTWRFVPTQPLYVPGLNPFAAPIPEHRDVTSAGGIGSGQDFYGIKKGDVNGTAKPYLFHPSAGTPLVFLVQDQALQAGEELSAVFRVSHFDKIGAYQVAFQFDPAQVQFIAVDPAQTDLKLQVEDHFGLYNSTSGEIRSVWEAPYGVSLPEGTDIFTLRFRALQSGVMLSEVLGLKPKALKPEATTTDQVPTLIQLIFIEAQSIGTVHPAASAGVQLLQNRPNPFTGQTIIGFILPKSCDVQLRVFDISGREVLRLDKSYTKGYHEESVRLNDLTTSGVLYYEMTTPFGKLTRKMFLVDK